MAAPTTVITRWNKTATVFDCKTAIATAATAQSFVLRNVGVGSLPWPMPSLNDHGLYSGNAARDGNSMTLGRVQPAFSVQQPLTNIPTYLFLIALYQNKTYQAGTTSYDIGVYTSALSRWYLAAQLGNAQTAAVNGVASIPGCIPTRVAIGIPAAGTDGGKCTLQADFLGHSFARLDALAGSAANTDSTVPYLSTEWGLTIGGLASSFVSANLAFTNGADRDPNINASPEFYSLGDYGITGDITVVVDPATSAWETLNTNMRAKTKTSLIFTLTRSSVAQMTFTIDVALQPAGEMSEQGNVLTQTFPFTAWYTSAAIPKLNVVSGSDTLVSLWP